LGTERENLGIHHETTERAGGHFLVVTSNSLLAPRNCPFLVYAITTPKSSLSSPVDISAGIRNLTGTGTPLPEHLALVVTFTLLFAPASPTCGAPG